MVSLCIKVSEKVTLCHGIKVSEKVSWCIKVSENVSCYIKVPIKVVLKNQTFNSQGTSK